MSNGTLPALLALLLASGVARAEVPQFLFDDHEPDVPLFVREDALLMKEDGTVTHRYVQYRATEETLAMLFDPSVDRGTVRRPQVKTHQRQRIDRSTSGCSRVLTQRPSFRGKPPRDVLTFDQKLSASDFVLTATVEDAAAGISSASPGTMLEVRLDEVLKGASWDRQTFYVFVPVADLTVGDKTSCVRDPEWAITPSAGDRLILLFEDDWFNRHSNAVTPDAAGLIVKRAEREELFVPGRFGNDEELPSSFARARGVIASKVSRREGSIR